MPISTTHTLEERINTFDRYYMMSDDHGVYREWSSKEHNIRKEISELSDVEKFELSQKITNELNKEYFGLTGLVDPTPRVEEKSSRSKVFTNAWSYFRKGIYLTFSECLRAAWKAYRVLRSLKGGIVSLTYRKSTGEIKTTTGTLNGDHFQYNNKGVRKPSASDVVKYFDLQADGWRSFRIERLIAA